MAPPFRFLFEAELQQGLSLSKLEPQGQSHQEQSWMQRTISLGGPGPALSRSPPSLLSRCWLSTITGLLFPQSTLRNWHAVSVGLSCHWSWTPSPVLSPEPFPNKIVTLTCCFCLVWLGCPHYTFASPPGGGGGLLGKEWLTFSLLPVAAFKFSWPSLGLSLSLSRKVSVFTASLQRCGLWALEMSYSFCVTWSYCLLFFQLPLGACVASTPMEKPGCWYSLLCPPACVLNQRLQFSHSHW